MIHNCLGCKNFKTAFDGNYYLDASLQYALLDGTILRFSAPRTRNGNTIRAISIRRFNRCITRARALAVICFDDCLIIDNLEERANRERFFNNSLSL